LRRRRPELAVYVLDHARRILMDDDLGIREQHFDLPLDAIGNRMGAVKIEVTIQLDVKLYELRLA